MTDDGVRTYRDLIAWQEAMDLVEASYRFTDSLPKTETYGLSAQIRRSAVSIPANIAEGYGRDATGSYAHFLRIARGSLRELETLILVALRVHATSSGAAEPVMAKLDRVGRLLFGLIRAVERSEQAPG